MRTIIAVAGAAAGLLLLAGCSGQQLGSARTIQPTGSEFSQNLYRGYVSLSEAEYAEGDYRDSDAFARRAKQAGTGGAVAPEDIAARKLPVESTGELTAARAKLVAALDGGAAERDPVRAADAQVMFDCWMQEQEENRQTADIAQCRDGFLAAVDSIAPPVAMSKPKPEAVRFIVYFPTNKAVLDKSAQQVIAEAQAAASKLGQPVVKISGNADTVGAPAYNQKLSELRAQAVAKVLAGGNLPMKALTTEAHGESQPAVMTADETSEPRNRRVEIILEP
ncbi:MAG: OmpA family protein [Alphaproteobacteria bacterium]|nr:OmpA family protein [Alphaproteobacteria bacterium]